MKRLFYIPLLILLAYHTPLSANVTAWIDIQKHQVPVKGERKLFPDVYKVFRLDDGYMKNLLLLLPAGNSNTIIQLPSPGGQWLNFSISQAPVMHPELAAKYPGIKNYTAVCLDAPAVTAKINYTYKGFNAMIYDGGNTYFIDPYTNDNEGYYICYYKKDYPYDHNRHHSCSTTGEKKSELQQGEEIIIGRTNPNVSFKKYGNTKKTFRLALSCTGEYAQAVAGSTPSKSNVLSAMTTSLTRVNGILERELSISLQLIANNDTLIYLDPATDSFSSTHNSIINSATQGANQKNIDTVIGAANYDIGHVFCTGDGGIADYQGLCDDPYKARAATGKANPIGDVFDVDYVVHEIGHQLGAQHTFNYSGPGCGTHAVDTSAYEPGSGSTIMAYAGLCSGNNVQQHSDDYFHIRSLTQISNYVDSAMINFGCGMVAASDNDIPEVPEIGISYNIPIKTPFELQAPEAADTLHNVLNYCWEQYDRGDFGKGLDFTKLGPIIRSFPPDTSRWRIFPVLDSIKVGVNSYRSEKMPEINRVLSFKLTVRDLHNGWGRYNSSDTALLLFVTDNSGPFTVTGNINNSATRWRNGNNYTVTWDVANTTAAPVSCNNVDIMLSLDYGETWPYILAANTPNDGSETITVPNAAASLGAYVKIKAVDNVFFDMNDAPFQVHNWPEGVQKLSAGNDIMVYPVPVDEVLNITTGAQSYYLNMHNSLGQLVYTGHIDGAITRQATIKVAHLAAGVYYLGFADAVTGEQYIKRVIIQ